ncbi:uncharacterized protein LOC118412122 isoform X2 [Branchiostoma floridae]|uniref:Uncharacterized protein LOC118412122 isoform X2 n=1 Tax=Branchiostoma floridae TaxID=7739 RepID=A0A9J7KVP8_BRAFL|nr:uncharacterized protein LOC118412122 isoform X2 [Branchiostoma floridae]
MTVEGLRQRKIAQHGVTMERRDTRNNEVLKSVVKRGFWSSCTRDSDCGRNYLECVELYWTRFFGPVKRRCVRKLCYQDFDCKGRRLRCVGAIRGGDMRKKGYCDKKRF